eukprot:44615-Chlamydomonas_euryale.AAC.2
MWVSRGVGPRPTDRPTRTEQDGLGAGAGGNLAWSRRGAHVIEKQRTYLLTSCREDGGGGATRVRVTRQSPAGALHWLEDQPDESHAATCKRVA